MDDYTLLYWSVPFRGQFVRAVLAFAGKSWTETGDDEIAQIMEAPVKDVPVPFMGPPVLVDNGNGFAVSQMPAIILYLGESLGLLPDDAGLKALTIKVVNDANDVIDEITLNGGRDMWDEARWDESRPRFAKWMTIWEVLGERHGLEADKGFLLGGTKPGIADVITATLWTTMADRFSQIEALLAETAPKTHALARRISALPALAALNETARNDYGDDYAGGEIGKSMARVLDA